MAVPYYPGALYTPKLGLGLFGQDEVLADNFVILDAAFGSGSSINVNGSLVISPNLNSTLPSAPAGKSNVVWQVDINGNVSAYASTAAWATLTGDLTETQVIPWDGATVGTPDTGISRIGAASLAIGNGTAGDFSGELACTTLLVNTNTATNIAGYFTTQGIEWDGSGTNNVAALFLTHNSHSAYGPNLYMGHSRGTQASPLPTLNSDVLSYFTSVGWDSSTVGIGAQILVQASTNWTTSDHSTTMSVSTVPAGSNGYYEIFRFGSNTDSGGLLGNASNLDLLLPSNHGISFTANSTFPGGAYAYPTDTYISRLSSGVIAIGTSQTVGNYSGALKLTGLSVQGTLTDGSASVGSSGQVLSSTATGIKWINVSGTGTVTNTLGSLTQYAVVIGNGGNDETVLGSLGTSGQVLTSGGAGVAPSWQSATTAAWSVLGNAAANLILSNAGYTTEFDQTSNVAWLWKNTTVATSGTTNASPLLELAANYWTGAASAADTWTIGSSLAAGTNGASTLSITHSGSTGAALISTTASLQANSITLTNGGVTITTPSGSGIRDTTAVSTDTFYIDFPRISFRDPSNGYAVQFTLTNSAVAWGGTVTLPNAGTTFLLPTGQIFLRDSAAGSSLSTDVTYIDFPNLILRDPSNSYAVTAEFLRGGVLTLSGTDNGISRLGAASLAIGNGTASDTTGKLSFGTVAKYNGTATVRNGIAAEYASSDLTAQSAAITATTLRSAPQTGMYKVSWSATITTASDISSVLGGTNGFQVIYTSPTDSVAKTTVPGNSVTSSANTTGTAVGGVEVIYAKTGTNIQFSYGYTDSHTSTAMAYELHITVEAM